MPKMPTQSGIANADASGRRPRLATLGAAFVYALLSAIPAPAYAQTPSNAQAAPEGQAIAWYSQGTKMAGRLFVPTSYTDGRKLPTIVLVHGYTGTMPSLLPFAADFAKAGFLSFAFDYRGWGQSEGERFRLDPFEQVEDIRNALSYVVGRPECDPKRIGIWGTSFGGAHVVYVGAIDDRVNAIVGQVGATDGRLMVENLAKWEGLTLDEYRARLAENATLRAATGKGKTRPAWPQRTPGPNGTVRRTGANPMIPLETDEKLLEYRPILFADRLGDKPLLLITAEKEELLDNTLNFGAVYAKATGPKQLTQIPGITHYEVYFGPGRLKVTALAIDWFKKHL